MKNIRTRKDGRLEFRKMINGATFNIYANNLKELKLKIKNFKPQPKEEKQSHICIDLIWQWFSLYKENQIKSTKAYISAIKNRFDIDLFKKDINKITLIELQTFLNNIKEHRVASYCYFIITGVFKYSKSSKFIKENISLELIKPKNKTEKGISFNLNEQKLIIKNLNKCEIKYEILYYLLTGARRSEAVKLKLEDIYFNRNTIFIDGTKTNNAKRYIPISETFKNILKNNFNNMFNKDSDYYTKKFKAYLKTLNINDKRKLHDLRHTFSTNLYYLGVPDKQRQYYMGHSSIIMTNDIYTHLDPTITKNDILNLYKDLYPKFWPKFWPKKLA